MGNVYSTLGGGSGGSGLADPGSNGVVVRTALNTTTARSLVQPAAGITITNSDGVSGNPTFALNGDLAALEALATNGMLARTGSSTYSTRTITGSANQITVTNGDGVSGNPTLSFPTTFYQIGTWTPTMLGTGTAGTPTYTAQGGRYTRLGQVCWISGRVAWSAHTGTGNMLLGGLPFTSFSGVFQSIGLYPSQVTGTPFSQPYIFCRISPGTTNGNPVYFNNGTGAVFGEALPSAGDISVTGVYYLN